MTAAAERRARRLLRAYPWRVRTELGEEIVGTVLDALPPEAGTVPWRDQLDIVRGGVRTRSRRRISVGGYVRYVAQLRVAERWLPWVIDDLAAPGFRRRQARRSAAHMAVLSAIFAAGGTGWTWPWTVGLVVAAALASALRVDAARRQIAARHGLGPDGTVVPPSSDLVLVRTGEHAPLPNLPVARLLGAVAVPVTLGAVASLAATARPRAMAPGPRIHAAAPADLLGRAVPYAAAGLAVGLVLAAVGLGLARRAGRAAPSAAAAHVQGSTIVSALLAGGLAVGAGNLAAQQWWLQEPWTNGLGAAVVGPIALGLAVAAGALGWVGRARSVPVGLWDVAPGLRPRRRVVAVASWAVHLMPGAEVLEAHGP